VWEKFHEAIGEEVAKLPGPGGMLARRFLALAEDRARELESRDGPHPQHMPFLAKSQWLLLRSVVGAKLYRKLGLDRARILVSGAAPIHANLVRWFHGIGLPIAEGYGQTEVALATTLNPKEAIRIGTVGPPLPGVSVRLADDGEILVKGGNVCHGYWHSDDQTRELFDPDGWLRSGDLGRFDERGYLVITGRKKDLIVTAHGKNIAPQELETDLEMHPLIGQAVVIGDGRRYLTALLALDGTATEAWGHEHSKGMLGLESLSQDPELRDELQGAVDEVNAHHARVEHIRNWRVLPRELTVSGGELTPTLKVKRSVVNEHYAELIADMYAQPRRRDEPTAETPLVE
jgi:long-chain acyl-CoA synthetase